MGITERREREREQVRTLILEAARDILSEKGLDALSVRAIAKRIEYSPATIYLYFQDKNALIRAVVLEGFTVLSHRMRDELGALSSRATPVDRLIAISRAYMDFALEHTAYFRVMFELPGVPQFDCPADCEGEVPMTDERPWDYVVAASRLALDKGVVRAPSAEHVGVLGWGVIHGLTSLYLGGHLREVAPGREDLWVLIQAALTAMFRAETAADTAA